MQRQLKTEVKAAIANQAPPKQEPLTDDLRKSVEVIADALLVNTLESKFEKQILPSHESKALDAALSSINSLQHPEGDLNYSRMKEGFVHLFSSLIEPSSDVVPGTSVQFSSLRESLSNLGVEVTRGVHGQHGEDSEEKKEEP